MAKPHTANYIEHIDALIKIMDVQTGKDNEILIEGEVLSEICQILSRYPYETGGIVGANENGIITTFQFDKTHTSSLFEYCPNIEFLNQVINENWTKQNIEFVGFVHSHPHNGCISKKDIEYAKQILRENRELDSILIGVFDLSKKTQTVKWKEIF